MHTGAAMRRRWTVVEAIVESRPLPRLVAAVAGVCALTITLDASVPLATGVTLAALLPAVLVDLLDRRLPDRLVGGAALVGLTVLSGELVFTHAGVAPAGVALGAVAMAGPLFVAHVVDPSSMGFGDVKTAAVAGS